MWRVFSSCHSLRAGVNVSVNGLTVSCLLARPWCFQPLIQCLPGLAPVPSWETKHIWAGEIQTLLLSKSCFFWSFLKNWTQQFEQMTDSWFSFPFFTTAVQSWRSGDERGRCDITTVSAWRVAVGAGLMCALCVTPALKWGFSFGEGCCYSPWTAAGAHHRAASDGQHNLLRKTQYILYL